MKIGIWDSGLGGITVLKELLENYRNNEYIYYGDLKNSPFGDKDYNELEEIGKNIVKYLRDKNVDEYVCACGTLSSIADKLVLETNNKKIYNVIDSIIYNLKSKNAKNVLLLATPATIKKQVFEKKIKESIIGINIYTEGCKEFVPIIEQGGYSKREIQNIVDKYIKKYVGKIDTVIYGCTHYGILSEYIENTLKNVNVIDAGKSIVKYLNHENRVDLNNNECDTNKKNIHIILSKESAIFEEKTYEILKDFTDNIDINVT